MAIRAMDKVELRSCEKNARKRARQAKPPAALGSIAATKYGVVRLTWGEEIEQSSASERRRLPTGAQVFNLPHKELQVL